MTSVQRPTDTPPPTCPLCGERGRGELRLAGSEWVGDYICPDGHIFIVRAFRDGAA